MRVDAAAIEKRRDEIEAICHLFAEVENTNNKPPFAHNYSNAK